MRLNWKIMVRIIIISASLYNLIFFLWLGSDGNAFGQNWKETGIETFVVYAFTIIKLLRAQFNLHISFCYLPFASNSNPPAYVGLCGIPLLPSPFAKHVG